MSIRKETLDSGWKLAHSYAELPETFYKHLHLKPVDAPELLLFNEPLAQQLGLNIEKLTSDEGTAVLAGNVMPENALPLAQAYAGHQFGNFTMLGDGRALLIGEQITPEGERVDIQLKGSGRTPFSRGGDGRAALGPMLREYIISEAMYALGVPTNRSLAVVASGEEVYRETAQPGAVMTRVASSHLRVGTFEYISKWGSEEELRKLADYTINRHFPEAEKASNPYLFLLQEVIRRQASLIAKWQQVGFIHGVMNTDNMALSGETIDYGPCAFMNAYHPATVFSSIDVQGRYAYGNQPMIAGWNLARFAETLVPLLHEDVEKGVEIAQKELYAYTDLYKEEWLSAMRAKLGLSEETEEDEAFIDELLRIMQVHKADYTNTFRMLTRGKAKELSFAAEEDFKKWEQRWKHRLETQSATEDEALQLMQQSNPAVIPRNHLVEEALEAAVARHDFSVIEELLRVLSQPYAATATANKYCDPPPEGSKPYQTYCGT